MQVEDVVVEFDWRGFESFVAEIFRAHDFKVRQNFRFKTGRRYEIDIVASSGSAVVCVDCKQWSGGRYKKSGLETAARDQETRTKELERFFMTNTVAQKMHAGCDFHPMVATMLEEDLTKVGETWVVPAGKLNSFLSNREEYF
jgi:Holliday junction resolvase-like predicted endonuclease